ERPVEPHARVTVGRWKGAVAIEAQALQNSTPRLSVEAQKGKGNPEQQVAGDHVGESHPSLDYHPGAKRDSSSTADTARPWRSLKCDRSERAHHDIPIPPSAAPACGSQPCMPGAG